MKATHPAPELVVRQPSAAIPKPAIKPAAVTNAAPESKLEIAVPGPPPVQMAALRKARFELSQRVQKYIAVRDRGSKDLIPQARADFLKAPTLENAATFEAMLDHHFRRKVDLSSTLAAKELQRVLSESIREFFKTEIRGLLIPILTEAIAAIEMNVLEAARLEKELAARLGVCSTGAIPRQVALFAEPIRQQLERISDTSSWGKLPPDIDSVLASVRIDLGADQSPTP